MAPQKKKAKVANVEEVKVVADTAGPCYLFDKLHDGVLRMIFEYAVTEDQPITPLQIKEKSNKFAWDVRQKKGDGKGFKLTGGRFHIKQLVAVQLCSVSKKMYDLVAGSHLLYTQNKFEFLTNHGLHTYLAAITPARRGQIKHMEIQLPNPHPTHGHNVSDAFTLLSTCQKLETLVIVVHALEIQGLPKDRAEILAFLSKLRGIKQLFLAVRGIKSVVCKTGTANHDSYLLTSAEFVALATKFRKFIDPFLQDEKEKAKQILPKGVVGKAITSAGLQIEGEGRLGGDRKSIISSRTRQSLRLEKDISIEGVLPPLEPSRLDADGNLTASVWNVTGSRKSSDDVYGIEFYVYCGPAGMAYTGKGWKSWESVAVLDTCDARHGIVDYYRRHPGAFGMQEVVDIWKVGGLEGYDKDDIVEKDKVTYLEQLSDLIKEQKMIAKQMAKEAEEAREKAAAAAANKKAEAEKKKAEAMKKKTQATKQKGKLASKKVTATPSGKRKPSHS